MAKVIDCATISGWLWKNKDIDIISMIFLENTFILKTCPQHKLAVQFLPMNEKHCQILAFGQPLSRLVKLVLQQSCITAAVGDFDTQATVSAQYVNCH